MRILVQICRFLVGALFIFSGLIKANDPVGFGVKLEDYFLVFADTFSFFRAPWLLQSTVPLAWVICVVEVALGIALLLGIRRKLVAWSLLLMIIFFTWLTGYSAITGAVTDCGCFGDAVKLTNWQTFFKNVVLMLPVLYLFYNRKMFSEKIPFLSGVFIDRMRHPKLLTSTSNPLLFTILNT